MYNVVKGEAIAISHQLFGYNILNYESCVSTRCSSYNYSYVTSILNADSCMTDI